MPIVGTGAAFLPCLSSKWPEAGLCSLDSARRDRGFGKERDPPRFLQRFAVSVNNALGYIGGNGGG